MLELHPAIASACVMIALALSAWAISFIKENTGIVDSFWGLFFLSGAFAYAVTLDSTELSPRAMLLLTLVALWSLRLTLHITVRNWGEPEDRRYQAIRARNQPGYALKSVYLVFGLQAVLAWIIGLPLFVGISGSAPLSTWDIVGAVLWLTGFSFEAIGDWQLSRFRARPDNHGQVMDRGLWRYTRHPNYFGEALLWWGFYLIAVPAGGGWALHSPVLMTLLLLKVSGVALLEKDIGERRPAYRDYVKRTNAFIPWMPRT